MLGFSIFVAIGVIVVVAIILGIQAERKRQQAIEQAAADLGLAYSQQLLGEDRALFDSFGLSQIGHSRNATNSIVADSGELRMVLFDYTYTTGSGKHKSTRFYSVVMATSHSLQLPQFSLTPENFFHRLGDFFGKKDIDFEDDEIFSRTYLLKGNHEPAIRELFNANRRASLMKLQPVSLEANRNTFIFYRHGKQRNRDHLHQMMEEAFTLYNILS